MPEITPSCPLCGSSQSSLFDRRSFRGELVTNCLCSRCGLVYQSPRQSEQELAAFYEQEYRQLYQGSQGPNPKDLAVQRGRAEALLAFTRERIEKVTRHLDIGCSAGLLLQRFHTAYGCQAVGIEPGSAYRAYTQQQGIPVFASREELEIAGEARFDLISLAHVLEHIPDPVGYLSSLRQNLLEKEGWLLVEVPNLYAHDSFEIAHLVAYSPHTLVQTLKKAGFEPSAYQEHGLPRSRLIPLYLSILARPASTSVTYELRLERGVRLKRRMGLFHRRLLTRLLPAQAWLPVARDS